MPVWASIAWATEPVMSYSISSMSKLILALKRAIAGCRADSFGSRFVVASLLVVEELRIQISY